MELEKKQHKIARLINGKVVDSTERVAVSIKGVVEGFPATLEAFMCYWPFSVSYSLELRTLENDYFDEVNTAQIEIIPRMGKGLFGFLYRIFLFESRGSTIGIKKIDKNLIVSYQNEAPSMRFLRYPGVADIIDALDRDCNLKEMIIKTDDGIFFNQGCSFDGLSLDLCRNTFDYLGELCEILEELFHEGVRSRE